MAQNFLVYFHKYSAMKTKIFLGAFAIFIATAAFSQDSTYNTVHSKITFKDKPQKKSGNITFDKKTNRKKKDTTIMYRDTRLGSSSPQYNTYKKNKFGAGAVTTNPNKIKTSKNPRILFLPVDSTKNK